VRPTFTGFSIGGLEHEHGRSGLAWGGSRSNTALTILNGGVGAVPNAGVKMTTAESRATE
jgi:hypothetical protein